MGLCLRMATAWICCSSLPVVKGSAALKQRRLKRKPSGSLKKMEFLDKFYYCKGDVALISGTILEGRCGTAADLGKEGVYIKKYKEKVK
jgi:hypothetical protein